MTPLISWDTARRPKDLVTPMIGWFNSANPKVEVWLCDEAAGFVVSGYSLEATALATGGKITKVASLS